jgi:hypothetical protein
MLELPRLGIEDILTEDIDHESTTLLIPRIILSVCAGKELLEAIVSVEHHT